MTIGGRGNREDHTSIFLLTLPGGRIANLERTQ